MTSEQPNSTRFQKLKDWFKNLNLKNLNKTRSDFINAPRIGDFSIANMANIAGGAYHGINALNNLNANSATDKDINSLKSDITTQLATNPMAGMYLDVGDEKLLREMKNGRLGSNNMQSAVNNALSSLPQAALNAGLGFLVGDPLGAVIQGGGTLLNAGIQGFNQGQQEDYSKLQGLYNKLQQANEEYRTMRRPSGLRTAGLQSRYYNQLY